MKVNLKLTTASQSQTRPSIINTPTQPPPTTTRGYKYDDAIRKEFAKRYSKKTMNDAVKNVVLSAKID